MSRGHPKVFLAIFVWHNFGKDFQQADAIRSQLQDIRPFGWVFSTSKSILSMLSILSILSYCAFYVHSMCIPSYIPARTLELNSWTRRNCGNVRETQGRAVFFVKEKKHWMNCEMRKTCRIRLIRKLPAFVEDVSFVSVEVFEVFRSQQRVQISEGRLAA
jgi:hypothetical protein